MTWKQLLESSRAEKYETSKDELDDLRGAIRRNLRDASMGGLSADNRFGIAYEAGLLLARMAIASAGYRVKGPGAHQTSLEALPLAMGPEVVGVARYLDRCRRKRNVLSYEAADVVSSTEALDLLDQVDKLATSVEKWIRKKRPELA